MGGQRHDPAALPPGKWPGTHCIGGWMGPWPVWTGAENIAPIGIRFPDHPTRSESLYRLSSPRPRNRVLMHEKIKTNNELYRIYLTLNLLTTTIVAPPSNASKWQMGFKL